MHETSSGSRSTTTRRLTTVVGVTAATGLVLALGTAPQTATAAPVVTTVQGQQQAPRTAKGPIGVFATGGDRVHISKEKYKGHSVASAHGWWVKGSAKATKADVTVWIQYKPKGSNKWRTVETKKQRIKAKAGKNKARVTAREVCSSHSPRQFRSVVDVDLVGYADSSEKLYTKAVTLKCTP